MPRTKKSELTQEIDQSQPQLEDKKSSKKVSIEEEKEELSSQESSVFVNDNAATQTSPGIPTQSKNPISPVLIFIAVLLFGSIIAQVWFGITINNQIQENTNNSDQRIDQIEARLDSSTTSIGILTNQVQTIQQKQQAAPQQAPANQPPNPTIISKISAEDRIKGNRDAQFSLIEYSDLQCPFCKQVNPEVNAFIEKNNSEINLVYRHFPLTNIHAYAKSLSILTECAGKQAGDEAFFDAIDTVFETTNPGSVTPEIISQELDLDVKKLTECTTDPKTAESVDLDYQTGIKDGVTGTPALFLYNSKTGKSQFVGGSVTRDVFESSFQAFKKGS